MKKRIAVLLLLCTMLAMTTWAAPNATLTAVDDQLLPLSDSTMPVRKGGEFYVPYTVFTGALGLNGSYNAQQQILLLYNLDNALRFSIPDGYVTDQAGNRYTRPAYSINGTYYVSVKLVCSCFGMSFSTISSTVPVLRIVKDPAAMTDHAFLSANADAIARAIAAYENSGTATTPSTSPLPTPSTSSTTNTPQETPVVQPERPKPDRVYLAFVGAPTAETAQILDILQGTSSTFFLSAHAMPEQDDSLRRMLAEGHAFGLSFIADANTAEPATLLSLLSQANDRLFLACGIRTRLLFVENGEDALSDTQRTALKEAGYQIWEATADGKENEVTAMHAAQTVLNQLQRTTDPALIRLRHSAASAQELTYLLQSLQTLRIPCFSLSIHESLA